jgi:hypothetical protein
VRLVSDSVTGLATVTAAGSDSVTVADSASVTDSATASVTDSGSAAVERSEAIRAVARTRRGGAASTYHQEGRRDLFGVLPAPFSESESESESNPHCRPALADVLA